jgi:PAS domain S-box-containing protein
MSDGSPKPLMRSLVVAPELEELGRARRFVAEAAAEAGFSDARAFDIMVASSEAAANAIEHAPIKGEVTIRWVLRPDRLEVQIEGPGEFQAPHRLTNDYPHRGLGLPLMAQFSDHLALYSGPRGGTLVSLTFYRPGVEPETEGTIPPSVRELSSDVAALRRLYQLQAILARVTDLGQGLDEILAMATDFTATDRGIVQLVGKGECLEIAAQRGYAESSPFIEHFRDGGPGTVCDVPRRERRRLIIEDVEDFLPLAGTRDLEVTLAEDIRSTLSIPMIGLNGQLVGVLSTQWRTPGRPSDHTLGLMDLVAWAAADFVDQRRSDAALRESEEHFRRATEAARIFAWEIDLLTGRARGAGDVERLFGVSFPQDVEDVVALCHPDDRERLREEFWGAVGAGGDFELVFRHPAGDGVLWMLATGTVIRDANGRAVRAVGVCQDVTARTQDQQGLARFFDVSVDILAIASSRDGRWKQVNRAFTEILGWTEEEALSMCCVDMVHPDDVDRSLQAAAELEQGSPLARFEHRLSCKGGGYKWISWHIFGDASTGMLYCSGRDRSLRKRVEEELRQSKEELEFALVGAEAGMWVMDENAGWMGSSHLNALFGRSPAEGPLARSDLASLIDPGDLPRLQAAWKTALADGSEYEHDYRVRWPDGSVHWLTSRGKFVPGSAPRILRGITYDITDKKNGEARLRREKALFSGAAGIFEEALSDRGEEELGEVCLDVAEEMTESAIGFIGEIGPDGLLHDIAVSNPGWAACSRLQPHGQRRSPGDFRIDRGIYGLVVQEERTVWLNDPASHPASVGLPPGHPQLTSFLGVPLRRQDRVVGVIAVGNRRDGYEREQAEVLEGLAPIVLEALDRKRAEKAVRDSEERYRAIAEENEHLYRQQLEIAENLQLALLNIPSEIGRLKLGHLYRSATEAARVGGDFYDVFEAKEGHIAILIGDVAGHGIQAARTGTMVKDVVHAFTHQSLRTNEVLRRTNLLLIEKDLPGFVTLFLGILDPETGVFRFSSAGHPESMLRRVSGEIQMLGCGTSPLGIYPDASWKPHEVELAPNDLLLLYTDGVTEARRSGELFGEQRLERLLGRKRISVGRLPHLILDQVLAFSGGALQDDVAILALCLTELPEGARPKQAPVQQKLLDG